jgi:tryptophan synthase beta chain
MDAKEIKGKTILVNLSGRGDKDMIQAQDILKEQF